MLDIANDGKVRSALISLKSALEDGVLSKQECEELFKRYDKDNSGTIERAEIQQMVGDIMVAKGQDKKEVFTPLYSSIRSECDKLGC